MADVKVTEQLKAMDPSLVYTAAEVDLVYKELGEQHVELDNDPLSFGPKRLALKVALTRRALARTERIFLDTSKRLQTARRALRIATTTYELAKKHLFANDPDTRAQRAVSDREAVAAGKLRPEIDLMNELTVLTEDLDAVLEVVKAKRTDLKDTEGRLRDQIRLCHDELGLGNRWGSQVPLATVDLSQGHAASDIDSIDRILGEVEGEIHLAPDSGPYLPDEPEKTIHENEISKRPVVPDPVYAKTAEQLKVPVPESAAEKQYIANQEADDKKMFALLDSPEKSAVIERPETIINELPVGELKPEPEGTASSSSVDSFIDSMPMEGLGKKTDDKNRHVAVTDADLSQLLADFEMPVEISVSK